MDSTKVPSSSSSESILKFVVDNYDLIKTEVDRIAKTRDRMQMIQKPNSRIKLDVGGGQFSTTIKTLTNIPNTFFARLFNGQWDVELEDDGSVFIDRDPIPFRDILNFMRYYPVINLKVSQLSRKEIHMMYIEARFYQIEPLVQHLNWSTYRLYSDIVCYDHQLLLEEWSLKQVGVYESPKYTLVHKGSKDGFHISALEWNKLYLTIFRSTKGHIFGSLTLRGNHTTTLFSLKNPAGLPPRCSPLLNHQQSNDNYFWYIKLGSECNVDESSFQIPANLDTGGIDNKFCDGDQTFLVSEFEIWKVLPDGPIKEIRDL